MTKNEAAVIVEMISTFYPNEFSKTSPAAMKLIVDMWAATCEAYTSEQITAAFQQFMVNDTKGYAPKPGQVIHYITSVEDENDMTADEAWSLALNAARNGIYHALEEFERLPELVQRAIGSSFVIQSWAGMDDASMSVEASHFKRTYRELLDRERQKRRMPPSTWKRLEGGDEPLGLPV